MSSDEPNVTKYTDKYNWSHESALVHVQMYIYTQPLQAAAEALSTVIGVIAV